MNRMERITLRVPAGQVDRLERQVEQGLFANRSEAIRTAIREFNERADDKPGHEMWAAAEGGD